MPLKRLTLPGHLKYPVQIVETHFSADEAVDERDALYTLSDAAGMRGIMRAPFSGIIREGPVEAGSTFSASVSVVGLEPRTSEAASQGSKDESTEGSHTDQQGRAREAEAIWLSSPADAAYPLVFMRREAGANVGKTVKKGDLLYMFVGDDVKSIKIHAPCDGEVLEAAGSDTLESQTPLVKILPTEPINTPRAQQNEDFANQQPSQLDEDLNKVLAQLSSFAKRKTLGAVRASITRALENQGHSAEDAKRAAYSEEVQNVWLLANQDEQKEPNAEPAPTADHAKGKNEDVRNEQSSKLDQDLEKVLAQVPAFAKGKTLGAVRASITKALVAQGHSTELANQVAGSEEVQRLWKLENPDDTPKRSAEYVPETEPTQAAPASAAAQTRSSTLDGDSTPSATSTPRSTFDQSQQADQTKKRKFPFRLFFNGLMLAGVAWAMFYVKDEFLFVNSDFLEFGIFLVVSLFLASVWVLDSDSADTNTYRNSLVSLTLISLVVAFYPLDESAFLSRMIAGQDETLRGAPTSTLDLQNLRRASNGSTPTPSTSQQQSFEQFMSQ